MSNTKLQRLLEEYNHAKRVADSERDKLTQAKSKVDNALQAQIIVQGVAEAVQQHAHAQIGSLVTRCLHAVFGDNTYSFKIRFEKKRGRTDAVLVFVGPTGEEIDDPDDGIGGGVVDVASFALRLAELVLARPRKRKLLVCDEPMRNLNGDEYQQRFGELILALSEELGIQIILATDDEWLKIGKVVVL
jgi:hypothetical protein